MKIYKVTIENEDIKEGLPFDAMYFEEQRTAKGVMNVFDGMLAEGKTIIWNCETIEVISHKEAGNQFFEIADMLKSEEK